VRASDQSGTMAKVIAVVAAPKKSGQQGPP
jgi:hypothetical protein